MTRRAFATTSAAALAAGPVPVALILEPTGDHLSHYRRVKACQGVGAVTEVEPAADLPERLAAIRPALAIVSLEPHRMPVAIEAAVDAGAHVLVEKPGCAAQAPFEAAARKAAARGREIMLAMATRLDPAAIAARGLVQKGWIGEIYGADMHWIADQTRLTNPAYQRSWKSSKKLGGGGKLIFHGIHYVDLLQWICASPVAEVAAMIRNAGRQPIEVEDAAAVSMALASGGLATLNAGYYLDRGYANMVYVWGSRGWFRFEPRLERALTWSSTAPDAPRGTQQSPEAAPVNVYDRMLQAAVDFARGAAPPFIRTADSLAALRVCFAAYASAESGRVTRVAV